MDYFFRTVTAAITSGNSAPIAEISLRTCKTCATIRENIDALYDARGRVESDGWILREIAFSTAGPASTHALDIRVTLTAETIIASPGAEPEQHDEVIQPMRATIKWTAEGWRMQELELKQ